VVLFMDGGQIVEQGPAPKDERTRHFLSKILER